MRKQCENNLKTTTVLSFCNIFIHWLLIDISHKYIKRKKLFFLTKTTYINQ